MPPRCLLTLLRLPLLLLLAACAGGDTSIAKQKVDADNDGFDAEVDCDDGHATVNPDAVEVCDDLDNDCDGTVDNEATDAPTWYTDADGDDHGDPATAEAACGALAGTVADNTDCDDGEAARFPGNPEICDELDNDCNEAVDDDASDETTFYADDDGDEYGDEAFPVYACSAPTGYVPDETDCDDTRADIHPDAAEADCTDPTDYNCDGSVAWADADGDGSPACEDCDDADAGRSPAFAEVCDAANVDEDCDTTADDADDSATGQTLWYRDRDGDGYAADDAVGVSYCEAPAGYVGTRGDCDDYDDHTNPGAAEVCDGLNTDEDCDGLVDDEDPTIDASTWNTWFRDADSDGHGDASRDIQQCDQPSSYVATADDCDDTDATRNPGEVEVCDAADVDEDCDGLADDSDASVTGGTTWYADTDRDGYGGPTTVIVCDAPSGAVATSTDCDDTSAGVHPGASEVCDAADVDEDCDGAADDADPSVSGRVPWYRDLDGDGYAGATSVNACDAPAGTSATVTDCDDTTTAVSPSATEVCDAVNIDEDCDGLVDDLDASVSGRTTWYRDADNDTWGGTTTSSACDQPSGYVSRGSDCNDVATSVNPGAAEVCDSLNVDEDCDGAADDADASTSGASTFWQDADGDTYGNAAVSTSRCDLPAGYVTNSTDCDDTNASLTLGGTWYRDADGDGLGTSGTTTTGCGQPVGYVANASDCNDANGSVGAASTWYRDTDGDTYGLSTSSTVSCSMPSGYVANATDCNDLNANISPADPEICDGANTDEDCDGLADDADAAASGKGTYYVDADGDTYGTSTSPVTWCDPPSGYVTLSTDCLDSDATVSPVGVETCDDGIDQDCSGSDLACSTGGFSGTYAVNTGYTTKIYGDISGDQFGLVLTGGDFDGDGSGDIVAGAPGAAYTGSYEGAAYVYYGPMAAGVNSASSVEDAVYYPNSSTFDNTWPQALYNPGDLSADTHDDLYILGSSSFSHGYIYYGGDTGNVSYSSYDLHPSSCGLVTPAGDFTATSGTDEWLCGTYSAGTTGSVYVYSGTSVSAVATFSGEVVGDSAGRAVDGGGDVDGDGYDDVWIGASGQDSGSTDAGAVYLVYAPISGSFSLVGADVKVTGGASGDAFGYTMDMAGDVNGDGHADIVVGASGADPNSRSAAGAVYVYTDLISGTYGAETSYAMKVYGEGVSDSLGARAPSTGDVNGDGEVDLLMGSQLNDVGGTSAGAVWLQYGPLSGVVDLASGADARWGGTAASDALGYASLIFPDWDGDGDDEIAMGAYNGDERGYVDHGAVYIWEGQ